MESKQPEIRPCERKKIRNHEIHMLFASGKSKEHICDRFNLSRSQLDKILKKENEEAEEWYKSLPRQTMIQIFRYNSEKIFEEIQVLEEIRNKEKEPARQFEMTRAIINAYSQYTKLVAEGPSLVRQKEVVSSAEKSEKGTK